MTRDGPGGVEPAAGAEEQAGADRAADGDHLDLPRLQALVVALVLGVEGRLRSMRLRPDSLLQSQPRHWGCWAWMFLSIRG